ncbi:arylesterase [Gayadomonas joobiniege]|uniref:arylesterase n=1 Tax=Gayadomonas joobiniege TaxID=1234606 RepID=UPI00037E6D31|nr:arylesterase [Gayadomonas joobiniege]
MLGPVRFIVLRNIIVFCTLILSFQIYSQTTQKTMLILGDSLSAGYGLDIEQAWASQLKSQWDKKHPNWTLINASVSGETTQGGLNRLPGLLETHDPDYVIIELGGNDGLRGFQLSVIKQNLLKIVQLIKASGATPVLIEIQIPPNYGGRYLKGFIQNYHEVAKIENIQLLPFFLTEIAAQPNLMQRDGIHPNAEAQSKIVNILAPKFAELMKN